MKEDSKELLYANARMADIINAIPGGVAIYKVSDIFETVYFSDGVPELTGYTVEEYQEMIKRDASEMTYSEDTEMVIGNVREALLNHTVADFEFRKLHRDGHIVWVHVQAKKIGEEDGFPLLHCVFHNITTLKETQLKLDHLVNSIPGGIAIYQIVNRQFKVTFFSDGVTTLSGHNRSEYEKMIEKDALDLIYEPDRERVLAATEVALESGDVLDVSYRIRHKNGQLIWIHLNGRRMGPLNDTTRFYAVFTGMSSETRLFQGIANETADGIYVVDKNNYDLLYASESKHLFMKGGTSVGQKCYMALHGKSSPCEFCTLKNHAPDGEEHEMSVDETDRFYSTRFRETDWNGIPAYIKYVRDITEEVRARKEKERLEQYFQTMVKKLPGGVAVVRYKKDGTMVPEFLSDGFAEMTEMSLDEAWELYKESALAGVHPLDQKRISDQMMSYIASEASQCEMEYRLKKGDGSYIWVKNTLSLIQSEGGSGQVYAIYHDMTKERREQERQREQYREMLMQHYLTPDPDALIIGHCNITQNKILEIIDHADAGLLEKFGTVREEFFIGLSGLVVAEDERNNFLNMYLNEPALNAFKRNDTERILKCFVKFPGEEYGRYIEFKVNMVETPDTGDITGILTVKDITPQMISEKILHQLSVTSYDFVIDLDLIHDTYKIVACRDSNGNVLPKEGSHSGRVAHMVKSYIVPKDKEQYEKAMNPKEIYRRLVKEESYTLSFSVVDKKGDVRTKNLTITAVDLRLGRVCLMRTDITESVREQQGLLNMMAYTFELMAFINIYNERMTLYTRQVVLDNLSPYVQENYNSSIEKFAKNYGTGEDAEEVHRQFRIETMIKRLDEKPAGYEIMLPYRAEDGVRYKQINVLWGDDNHSTVCLVRADVTDMLAAERKTKTALEKTLAFAEEANRAKSDFLSTMSHDIRTPMNAIMGMTALAFNHLEDSGKIKDYLEKISMSSKHLLSLINDILDMSKIEQSKITLNKTRVHLPEQMEHVSAIMSSQAAAAGLRFQMRCEKICHEYFYADALRMNQILINILSNAVKFTPEGGAVDFIVEELTPVNNAQQVRYRFTISDSGIGISESFLDHIFEPFVRSGESSRIEGTGLGLSICKGLVDMMGGVITVESQVKKGTTFRIEIEFEAVDAENESTVKMKEMPSALEQKVLLDGRRFLVVEDNAINAEILCGLLNMYGAESVVRTDGLQAVKEFRESPAGTYDAVLMDIQMPVMNGYEATRIIRETKRADARTIPIVAMTANAFAEDVRETLKAGMNAHVSKPIDVEILQSTLKQVLK